jgi:CTP:molybdopterin cytidylyltransferase MocA
MSVPVAAIVLAAGASKRLGQPKQLLMHAGETLLARVVRLAGEAGAAHTVVVLGADAESICAAVDFNAAVCVVNEEWQEGIASSIRSGLAALEAIAPDIRGALIVSCDQPRLGADHLRALMDAFAAQAETSIVASKYAHVLGIPAVFPRAVFDRLNALSGDKGARALFAEPPCSLIDIDFPGGEIDIDTPADLAELE